MSNDTFKEYKVWDASTRVFHWVNFTTIILLIIFGMLMLYKKELGIVSLEAKIALKEVHILVGYVFALNLIWRIIWGFIGSKYARWKNIFPGKGFFTVLKDYKDSIKNGQPQQFLGHNPMGRLAISFMILLMVTLMGSGLIRAGTDIYYPPFGSFMAEYVADENTDPADILPYNAKGTDKQRAANLKAFKKPFGVIHLYTAYTLMFIILIHIFFVVRTEKSEGGSLVSAMITGKKILKNKPVDLDD
ncbi:MAG: cytochrome b/b6 domain-containing protein [Pseudomonadota bacterium]